MGPHAEHLEPLSSIVAQLLQSSDMQASDRVEGLLAHAILQQQVTFAWLMRQIITMLYGMLYVTCAIQNSRPKHNSLIEKH